MNKTSLLIVVALLSSAFSVNPTFAQGTSLEWRTVYNSKDNFQCGYLLPTKPKTPTARPDGVRDDAEFRTVLREGGRPVNGWLQADIGVHERGTCPHCKARAKGNPSVGNTSVTNVSVPSPGFNRGGYNAARTQRLGVATGAYTPVPGVPASNSGMFINGAWYAQPPKTTVDISRGPNGSKLMRFTGGVRGAGGQRVDNIGNSYYQEGDIEINHNEVTNSYNHEETHNTSTTVNLPPPARSHDYCGHRHSSGAYWCHGNRTWYRTRSLWLARNCSN